MTSTGRAGKFIDPLGYLMGKRYPGALNWFYHWQVAPNVKLIR